MATPAYATDLTSGVIIEEMPNTTGWTLISSGGGGASSQTAPETDDYIQGANCTSRNPWSSSIRGMVYNSSQSITAGKAVYVWWKGDVAQTLAAEASGGVQILIGNLSTALKCFYVAGSDTYLLGGWRCAVIDPTTTPSTNLGSPDGTTSYFGARWNIPSSGPSKGYPFKIDAMRWGSYVTITAGEAADPATWAKLATYDATTSRRWGIATPTDTGAQVQGIINWGSAGTAVYSRDTSRAIVLLDTKGFTSTSFTQIVIQNASTDLEWDNISILALGTLNRGLISILNNAKAWLTNCTFTGLNTITDGGTSTKFDGSTFRGCNAVTAAGGSFLGSKFLVPTVAADAGALAWNLAINPDGYLDNSQFSKGTNAHHAIAFGTNTPTSITLRGLSFSGFNASDGQNDSVLLLPDKGSNQTWTINCIGTSGTVSYKKLRSGDTVNIVINPVTLGVTVKDLVTGSVLNGARVYVVAAAGGGLSEGTVLISDVTVAGGRLTDSRTYTQDQPITGWVRMASSAPYYKTGPIGGTVDSETGLEVLVQMVRDE